jgi:ankyrin repeat protein
MKVSTSHGRKKGNSDRREGKDGEKRNINKSLPILRSSDISPEIQENEPAEPGRGSENNKPDQKNLTKLMKLAITKNYQELEEFLNSMDPSLLFAKDYKGRTALDWARLQNNQMSINLISNAMSIELNRLRMENIGYVVSNEIVIKQTNQRLMQQLSDAYDAHDSHRILQILLDSQISRDVVEDIEGEIYFVDFQTPSGDTALLRAAGNGWYDVVIELLAMGCDINKSNKYGHNPLTWSCVCGHAEIVRTLLVKDAKFTHQTKELRTCLHYACLYLKSRVVSVIMDVLFEKFSMFRMISHPFTKYDPSRWKKYAEILDNFLMVSSVCYALYLPLPYLLLFLMLLFSFVLLIDERF